MVIKITTLEEISSKVQKKLENDPSLVEVYKNLPLNNGSRRTLEKRALLQIMDQVAKNNKLPSRSFTANYTPLTKEEMIELIGEDRYQQIFVDNQFLDKK